MQKKPLGIVLIVIGIIMIIYTGFDFATTEKVVDLGPVQRKKEKNHTIKWPPIIGIVILVGGITIIVTDKKTRS